MSLTIDSIIDTVYGDLGSVSNGNVTDNNCPDLIGDVLDPGGSTSCSFKAFVSGDSGETVPDKVEVCGTDTSQHDVCDDDDAEVSITDSFTAPTLTKTAQSAANCTVDVTYQVVVSNNSELDSLTVNSLTDDIFGDITTAHPAGDGFGQVVTPCPLQADSILPLGNYTCSFVGRIVSSTCSGTLTDIGTGGVTDDDGKESSPSDSASVQLTAPTFP